MHIYMRVCVCVVYACLRVCLFMDDLNRERERERENQKISGKRKIKTGY